VELDNAGPVAGSPAYRADPVQRYSSCLWRPSARTVLIFYLSCTACTSWRPDTLTPQAVVQGHPRSLRVTRRDSSQVILTEPQLQGDTILGVGPRRANVRVPLDSVLLTDTRHGDGGMTVLVVVGVLAALFAVATAVLPHSY
jgi:hypothetical protein